MCFFMRDSTSSWSGEGSERRLLCVSISQERVAGEREVVGIRQPSQDPVLD